MNEETKNAIVEQFNKMPPMIKYDVALLIMAELYEKLPMWKEEQQQCSKQILENLLDFLESIKGGAEQ